MAKIKREELSGKFLEAFDKIVKLKNSKDSKEREAGLKGEKTLEKLLSSEKGKAVKKEVKPKATPKAKATPKSKAKPKAKTKTSTTPNVLPFSTRASNLMKKEDLSWADAKAKLSKEIKDEKDKVEAKLKADKKEALNELEKLTKAPEFQKALSQYPKKGGGKKRAIKTTLSNDGKRQALPRGKRVSKNGKTYYEYRDNRSDVNSLPAPKGQYRYKGNTPPYLESGGAIDSLKKDMNSKLDIHSEYYAKGGRTISIVNDGVTFDKSKYKAVYGDFDKDGIVNIDDANPLDKTKSGQVEQVELRKTFDKLLGVKAELDEIMYDAVETLDEKAPEGADIYARTKTPYSILKKLVEKRMLDPKKGLTDMIGTTIAVDNQKELEEVRDKIDGGLLGKVLDRDDFYKTPNAGYRAYHYIVEYKGVPVEVQLKTKNMKKLHEVSHESYKKGTLDAKSLDSISKLFMRADKGDAKAKAEISKLLNDKKLLASKVSKKSMAKGGVMQYEIRNVFLFGLEKDANDFFEMADKFTDYDVLRLSPFAIQYIGGKEGFDFLYERAENYESNLLDIYAKGGKTKQAYEYVPQEAIDELSYTMGKVSKSVSGSNVLSGAYVKSGAKAKTKSKGANDLTKRLLAMTDDEDKTKVILEKDVKEMQNYVSDKLIIAFYLGLPKAYDFKADFSYEGGIISYRLDAVKKRVSDTLKNIKANKFEMGLKYPQYDFEKLLGKPIIKDVFGKTFTFNDGSTEKYKYRLWIWKDCVIGQTIGSESSRRGGYTDYTYGEEPTLIGGYKSVQTSKASKLESIIEFMAKDKNGYVKDNAVLYNNLGGATFEALDKNKIKYEAGGTLPTPFGQAGLVGETGAMNEMDMFAMGGGLPQGVQQYYVNTYNPAYPTPHGYAKGGEIDLDEYYSKMIEKLGKKGAFERVLKDSQFVRYKGTPQNQFTHNRLPIKAIIGRDNGGANVTIEGKESTMFDNPNTLAKYLDKNEIYAKGGEVDYRGYVTNDVVEDIIKANGLNVSIEENWLNGYEIFGQKTELDKVKSLLNDYNIESEFKQKRGFGLHKLGVPSQIIDYAKGGETKRSKHSLMQDRRRVSSEPWEVTYQKRKSKMESGGTLPTPFGQAGLVGETGAMNEMDMFAMGGGLPQGVQQYYANTYNPAYPTPHGYAKGGIIKGAGKSGLDKIKKISKDNPSQMYKVTDDNYSNIGNFYLKNGKFAKKTVSNADYDFAKNKVSLRPKSDVIYKATEIEGKGGYFEKGGKTKSSGSKRQTPMSLAKEIRKEGENWQDAVKRASAMLKKN